MEILTPQDETLLKHYLLKQDGPGATAALLMLLCGTRTYETTSSTTLHLLPDPGHPESILIPKENAKRANPRTIPLPYCLRDRFKETYIDRFTALPGIPVLHVPLCRDRHGNPMPVRNLQNYIHHLGRRILKRHLTPYTLRHTFATTLKDKTDLATLMVILGHKRLSTTQIYLHPSQRDLEKAINGPNAND